MADKLHLNSMDIMDGMDFMDHMDLKQSRLFQKLFLQRISAQKTQIDIRLLKIIL